MTGRSQVGSPALRANAPAAQSADLGRQVSSAARAAGVPVDFVWALVAAGASVADAAAVTTKRLEVYSAARPASSSCHVMLSVDRDLLEAGVPPERLIAWMSGERVGLVGTDALRALGRGVTVQELLAVPPELASMVFSRFVWAGSSGWASASVSDVSRLVEAGVRNPEVFAVLQAGYPVDDMVALAHEGLDFGGLQWSVPVTEGISADADSRRLVLLLIGAHEVTHAAASAIAELLPAGSASTASRFLIDGMPVLEALRAAAALSAPALSVGVSVAASRVARGEVPGR